MSAHASTKIDQKEYLKKYLSGDKSKKKKKDKKRKREFGSAKVKIIDDDATYNQTQEEFDEELLLGGEDAPQIVGEYIEDISNVPKWRSIVVKEEPEEENEVSLDLKPDEDLWGPKQIKRKIKDEFSPPRRNRNKEMAKRSPDISPPRRKHKNNLPSKAESRNGNFTKDKSLRAHNHSPSKSNRRGNEHSPYQSTRRESRRSPEQYASRRNERTPDYSPRRNRNQSPDGSLPKTSKSTLDQSPLRRDCKRTSDLSPRRRVARSPDQSPPKKAKRLSEESPPKRGNRTPDRSPVRKNKRATDQSPPRRRYRSPYRQRNNSSSQSPPRKSSQLRQKVAARSSSSDQSPPRKDRNKSTKGRRKSRSRSAERNFQQHKKNASYAESPPRSKDTEKYRRRSKSPTKINRRNSSDKSPPTRYDGRRSPSRKHQNDSPVRIKREKCSPDQSPPRRRQDIVKMERSPSVQPKPSRWTKLERRSSDSPPPTHKPKASKTLDGKKAGIQDAKSLMQETEERRQREERMYNEMSKEVSGRDAEVRVRSTGRKGQRARDAEEEDPEKRRRKEEHERRKKEKYDRWGKGLKQVEEHRQRAEAESYEGSKPLARYENDEDLDRYLREQERADDPMLEYMRKKKKERQKETGALAEIPKYEGSYPENRFGIRPGYRWDGVDRSNGFEKKWFDVQNEKRAAQVEAYLYSVEDM
ncbi:BUD13 homolog [Anastrepha obliqua]|uniref:BUD13 homolog n=1 Tax=Anastrepha obliqua TaxID=95512 RepID=UPI00240A1138|nr:BUD13 homolog [Anastrepha obliqua]